jgi:enhanced disease susceptibility 1 protein
MGERLGERLGIKEEVIIKACSISIQAHTSTKGRLYVSDKAHDVVVFALDGFRSVQDWMPFGETKIDRTLFPSIRSIGTDDVAVVNTAVLRRFEAILKQLKFVDEVEKAMKEKKQIVFAGHSVGGGVAMLITIWFLDKYIRAGLYEKPPSCVTFGSVLIGNRIISHALQRENWADYFIHFVTKYDIVPRIMLTPLSTIEKELGLIIPFKKTPSQISNEASDLFKTVMKNVSYVASHVASKLMGCTNPLLETILGFVPLSPYRPFGTYIFTTGNGRLGVVKNSDAALQMLFYCAQLNGLEECGQVASRSLDEHMIYESELKSSILQMQDIIYLDRLQELPLSSNVGASPDAEETNNVLNDFGLSARARLCLRAAGEFEKQKLENQTKIDSKRGSIRKGLSEILQYKQWCESHGITYYDSFKLQKDKKDFEANIARLDIVGIWDELIEMLKRSELPDNFEGRKDWIELGTEFRRLVEPLDISNYYRHLKNEDTGAYMARARPKRYRFTQRWREHQLNLPVNTCSETCFLARVEELRVSETNMKEALKLEHDVFGWVRDGELGTDVFIKGSTFVEWWRSLPEQHKYESCLKVYMSG